MKSLLLHRKDCATCGVMLVASDQLAEEDLNTFKAGKDVLVEARFPRSTQHHRLLFALLRKVCRAAATEITEEALLSYVKVKTGHVEAVPLRDGGAFMAPASIAFRNMDQSAFREFFDRVVQLILTDIAPNLPPSFADEFLAMLDTEGSSTPAPQGAGTAEPPPNQPPAGGGSAPTLELRTLQEALAWADSFTAKIGACHDQVSAQRFWKAAKENGRLNALLRFDPVRFNQLNDFAAAHAERHGWKSPRKAA